jgi:RNA polymerase sigma-70 factor, ECF subfamily
MFNRGEAAKHETFDSHRTFLSRRAIPSIWRQLTRIPLVNDRSLAYHVGANLQTENVTMVGIDNHRNSPASFTEPGAEDAANLMRAIAKKDRRAFEKLYYIYSPRLGRYLLRLLKRREVVDEVLNDVMLVVWQSAERYDPSLSRLSTWLFGIAHNKALKAMSNAKRHQAEISIDPIESDDIAEASDPSDPMLRPDTHNPEQTLIGRQLGRALQWAIDSLSADHRAVIELAFAEDYSYQEIATTLACPVNTVKTRMFYARKHLAELLARQDQPIQTIVRSNLS